MNFVIIYLISSVWKSGNNITEQRTASVVSSGKEENSGQTQWKSLGLTYDTFHWVIIQKSTESNGETIKRKNE